MTFDVLYAELHPGAIKRCRLAPCCQYVSSVLYNSCNKFQLDWEPWKLFEWTTKRTLLYLTNFLPCFSHGFAWFFDLPRWRQYVSPFIPYSFSPVYEELKPFNVEIVMWLVQISINLFQEYIPTHGSLCVITDTGVMFIAVSLVGMELKNAMCFLLS
jgi:hypothetical protein